jgi:hypothetical protein
MTCLHSGPAAWDGPAKLLKARQQANGEKLTAPVDVALARLQVWPPVPPSTAAQSTECV